VFNMSATSAAPIVHCQARTREFDLEFERVPHKERLAWVFLLSCASHSFFVLTGLLLSNIYPCIGWWWLEANYLFSCIGGYTIHFGGHQKGTGRWYQAHMEHHIKLFPPHRFLNDKMTGATDSNGKFYWPLFVSSALLSYLLSRNIYFSSFAFLHVVVGMLLCDYLHEGFHLRGFWLEDYRWFMSLRELHYIHHKGHMQDNLEVYDFWLDFLLGSFSLGLVA